LIPYSKTLCETAVSDRYCMVDIVSIDDIKWHYASIDANIPIQQV
jgi:hypothetical protein